MLKSKLTTKDRIKYHRELWFWLAENPDKDKTKWPGWEKYNISDRDVVSWRNTCFACGEDKDKSKGVDCSNCPITWHEVGQLKFKCAHHNSIYYLWEYEDDLEMRSIMAEIIACKWE